MRNIDGMFFFLGARLLIERQHVQSLHILPKGITFTNCTNHTNDNLVFARGKGLWYIFVRLSRVEYSF